MDSRNPAILESMKRVTVDFPEEAYEQLRKMAFDHRKSVSAAIREAVSAWLASEKRPPQPGEGHK
jgi:Arc/MetJ-type ribon-helix-helix transcriptional regulator